MKECHSGMVRAVRLVAGALGLVLLSIPALAQTAIGFEPPDYQGSAQGVSVTGQQGWYLPDAAGAVDQSVYTYDGNQLGLATDATGETQFVGGQPRNLNEFPRAQLNFDWSTSMVWTVSYDLSTRFNGALPAGPNISSFSLQDSAIARFFIALNAWLNPDVADTWAAAYIVFSADDVQQDPQVPGDAWLNLVPNHWYRESTTFDFASNTILSVSLTDLDTGVTVTAAPTGWFLQGGSAGRAQIPTALRFFVGGAESSTGNIGGFDNLLIEAGGAGATLDRSNSAQPKLVSSNPGSATN